MGTLSEDSEVKLTPIAQDLRRLDCQVVSADKVSADKAVKFKGIHNDNLPAPAAPPQEARPAPAAQLPRHPAARAFAEHTEQFLRHFEEVSELMKALVEN